MEMRMETLAPKTQKRTATTKRMTSHLIGGIGNKKFDMSNIEHRSKNETFDATTWEKKLYAKGEVFSKQFVESKKLFALWNEGVENSEVMFANYQQALLYVLQHLYSYLYYIETMYSKDSRVAEKKLLIEAIEQLAKDNDADKEYFKSSSVVHNIIKIAYAKQYIKATKENKRSLQKRLSTYSNVLINALTKGEDIKGKTDEEGRIEPQYFQSVVLANGGINAFSRLSKQSIALADELKEKGFESVSEMTASEFKQHISNGEITYLGNNECKHTFLNSSLDKSLDEHLDIEVGEYALALVRKDEEANVVTLFSTNTNAIQSVLNSESTRIENETVEQFTETLESELAERDEDFAKKLDAKRVKAAIGMTLTDLKTLEKAQQLALKHGGFENAVKIYGDYVSGDNLISGEYAFNNKNEK